MNPYSTNKLIRNALLFISFFLISTISFSQTWEKAIENEDNEAYPAISMWNNQIILCYTNTSGTESSFNIKYLDENGSIVKTQNLISSNANYSFSFNSKTTIIDDTLFVIGTAKNKSNSNSNILFIKYNLKTTNYFDSIYITNDTNDFLLDYIVSDTNFIIPGFSEINGIYHGHIIKINFQGEIISSQYISNTLYISGYLWNLRNKISARTVGNTDFRFNSSNLTFLDSVVLDPKMYTWGGSFTSSLNQSTHYISGESITPQTSISMCSVLKIESDSINSRNYTFGRITKDNKVQGVQPIAESDSGILFLVGSTSDQVRPIFSPDPTEIALFKTNPNGDTLFMKFYKGEVKYIANSIIATKDGGAIIASNKYDWNSPYPNQWDIHLLKVDSLGNYTPLSTPDIEKPEELKVIVYPNPATNQVSFSGLLKFPAIITIYDILGREVKTTRLYTKSDKVDISQLNSGTYVFRVNSDNQVARGKFLVE